jgi:hypothetical protein
MNTTSEPIKQSQYILRRESESFSQFADDFWQSVPVYLLVVAALVVAARVIYGIQYRKAHGAAKPDAPLYWLGWAAIASVAALVIWTLVAFYKADTATTKAGTTTLTALSESNERMWYIFTGSVLGLGALFVVLMYIKDSRSVRWFWAAKLSLLRITVYALLCFVFLLPARQTWERTEKTSRVVVLIDISPSMTRLSDDVAGKGKKQKTRMDVLIDFLQDKDIALLENLLKTNPVAVYAFGSRLDESSQMFERDAAPWGPAEWAAFATYDFRPFLAQGLSEGDQAALAKTTSPVDWGGPKPTPGVERLEPTNWAEWAQKWAEHRAAWAAKKARDDPAAVLAAGLSAEGNAKLAENIERLERRIDVARSISLGTNVPDSISAALNREAPNMVQGVIVFSDMRSNLGSDSSYASLRSLTSSSKIPVFTIAIGTVKQNTSINITEILADDAVSNLGSKITVEADGIGLNGKTVNVELDLYLPGMDPKGEPAYTLKTVAKEKAEATARPATITFTGSDTPHGKVQFTLDPTQLAADPDVKARNLVTESTTGAFKKPVLKEGKWLVKARIARDENETFAEPFHVRELPITVVSKKLRVLLIADAPTREFQFLRTFLNREVQDNRAVLTLLVQNEAGMSGQLTPNPTETVIQRFPTKLDLSGKTADPKEKPYNLNEYDVIVAFDPNWKEVSQQQAEDLQLWVERQGGGFVFIPDRINTEQLARVDRNSPDGFGARLKPILDLLPVEPDDPVTIAAQLPAPRTPRRLYLHPIPDNDLLKIDDPPPPEKKDGVEPPKEPTNDPAAGWELYFTDRDKYVENKDDKVELFPRRGFFSCYPVKQVKPAAHVLADFVYDDFARQKATRPWLVVSNPGANFRTAFLASGEIYRMYAYDKLYYEKFWDKLLTYMAEKRNVKASRGHVQVSREVISGRTIRVQAQILNTSSKPYPPGQSVKFTVFQVAPDGTRTLVSKAPVEMKDAGIEGYYTGQTRADPNIYPPGEFDYFVEIEVPDSAGDILKGKFQVIKSDLEMNEPAPDFGAHLRLASDFDGAFQARVPENVKKAFTDAFTGLPRENGVPKLAFSLSRAGDRALIKLIPDCFTTEKDGRDVRGPVDDLWDEQVALYSFELNKNEDGKTDPRTIKPGSSIDFMHNRLKLAWRPEDNPRPATPFKEFFRKGPKVFRAAEPSLPPQVDEVTGEPIRSRWPAEQIAVNWVVLVVVFLLCWEWLTRKLLRLA